MILAFLNKQTGKGKLVVGNPLAVILQGLRMKRQGFTRAKITSGQFNATISNPKIKDCYTTSDGRTGLT